MTVCTHIPCTVIDEEVESVSTMLFLRIAFRVYSSLVDASERMVQVSMMMTCSVNDDAVHEQGDIVEDW